MEFWLKLGRVTATRQSFKFQQMCMSIKTDWEVMEFHDKVMEKSWNFVAKISWQPWFKTIYYNLTCDSHDDHESQQEMHALHFHWKKKRA